MQNFFDNLCNTSKVIIGGVHFLPLPGTPDYDKDGGIKKIYQRAREDALKLQEGGVDSILFANEADTPYETKVGHEITATMVYCIGKISEELKIPFGINMLLDPIAGISVAHSTGGQFVRGYFTGGYVGDMGIMNTNAAKIVRYRNNIGGNNIKILTNLTCAFGVPLAQRDLKSLAYGAITHAKVDGLIVSGMAAGFEIDLDKIDAVKSIIKDKPVLAGTGVNHDNVRKILLKVDGIIVASSLKVNGETLNKVDLNSVKKFMSLVKEIRN